ncbi:MAG: DHH family phosphoesterase [Limnochordia bacterium]|jgi:phosphoesterase RecJ-like protein
MAKGQVIEGLTKGQNWLLTGHVDLDPDCLGSLLALKWALERMGKQAQIICATPVPPTLRFLPGSETVLSPNGHFSPDGVVIIDCERDRTGLPPAYFQGPLVINIDHHQSNPRDCHINWVEPAAAAAGELVYELLVDLALQPDRECATCLYASLVGDTGGFRYSNTTGKVLTTAAQLVELGAQPGEINRELYENRPLNYMKILGEVLNSIECVGPVAWAALPRWLLEKYPLDPGDLEGFVGYTRMIRGVELGIFFTEGPAEVKVSFRSQRVFNVGQLAQELGGGGHPRAAGCTLPGSLEEVVPQVLSLAQHHLRRELGPWTEYSTS